MRVGLMGEGGRMYWKEGNEKRQRRWYELRYLLGGVVDRVGKLL